jgi:ATP-binding cassette subfamily C protein
MLEKLKSLVFSSGAGKVRVKTPTVLQLEAVECGAASLAMVLGYHGRIVPLTTLRQECGVSRDGSKASNIVAAARRFGMNAKGYAKDIEDLKEMQFPVIIFWNFNHFVTVEGYDKNNFYLNDPAAGHRIVDNDSFGRQYTGIVLQLEPGPEFVKEGKRPSLIGGITKRMKGSGLGALFVFLIGLLLVIPGLAVPAFNQVFIDRVILDNQTDWLRPLILAMLIAVILQGLLRFMQLRYLRRLRIKLMVLMSSSYIWHLLRLPASFYSQRYPGEVANRSQLNEKLAGIMSGQLAQTAIDVLMMVFYAALMFSYDVVLTLIGIAFALINVVLLRWSSKNRVESNMKVLQEHGKAQGVAVAGLQGIETIKSGGLESGFFGQWAGYYAKGSNARQELELSNRILDVAPTLLNALAIAAVLIIGAFRVISGDITIGMLVAYQSLMQSFLAPVSALMAMGGTIQEMRGDLERIDDVLAAPAIGKPIEKTTKEAASLPKLSGSIEVKNLTFGYSPREPALIENFNVSIRPGSWVALVGGSGSGKTTIARIISGEYEPWEGKVVFDGKTLADIHNLQITKSISTVDQEISLFRGNVRDNLTLWDSKIDDADIKRACDDAVILEVVQGMPGGLDAELIEGGTNLSGGQRQRLEIARSLVRDPTIILFDEATSALDAETERLVMDKIRNRGCTAIIVAHRLSTIRDCDEIIVMDKGKIKERGTHSELWNANGHYRQLMMADQ